MKIKIISSIYFGSYFTKDIDLITEFIARDSIDRVDLFLTRFIENADCCDFSDGSGCTINRDYLEYSAA